MMSNYYKSGSDVCFRRLSNEYAKKEIRSSNDSDTSFVKKIVIHPNTIPDSSLYGITQYVINKTSSSIKNL